MACLFPFVAFGRPVPCGKCPQCLITRASSWIFRLSVEHRHSLSTQFVTMTYDSFCVPRTSNGLYTLDSTVVPSFIKRLRAHHYRQFPDWPPIKYYIAGEYGGVRRRPHYHAIITNCHPDLVDRSWVGNRGTEFQGISLGGTFIDPRPFDKAAIGYVTGYMHKPKIVGYHPFDDRLKERAWMSQGIGLSYITDSVRQHHLSSPANAGLILDGGVRSALPRYFRDRIFACSSPVLFQDAPVIGDRIFEYRCESCPECLAYQAYIDESVSSRVDEFTHELHHTFNGDISKMIHFTHEARLAYTDNFFKQSINRMDL